MVERSENERSSTAKGRGSDETSAKDRPPIGQWSPANVLETPPDKDGYRFRWVREEVNGSSDRRRVAQAIREGYVRVNMAELDENFQAMCDPDTQDGISRFGGLVLMKMPLEFVEQRNNYYRKRSREARFAVDELQGVAGNNAVQEDRGTRALDGAEGGAMLRSMSQK